MGLSTVSKGCLVGLFTLTAVGCASIQVEEKLVVDDVNCDMFVQTLKTKKGEVVDDTLTPLFEVSQRCLDRKDVQREMEILTVTAASGDKIAAMTFMNLLAEKNPDINGALQSALVAANKEARDIKAIAEQEAKACTPFVVKQDGGLIFSCGLK